MARARAKLWARIKGGVRDERLGGGRGALGCWIVCTDDQHVFFVFVFYGTAMLGGAIWVNEAECFFLVCAFGLLFVRAVARSSVVGRQR